MYQELSWTYTVIFLLLKPSVIPPNSNTLSIIVKYVVQLRVITFGVSGKQSLGAYYLATFRCRCPRGFLELSIQSFEFAVKRRCQLSLTRPK